jgi:hypothetical protein
LLNGHYTFQSSDEIVDLDALVAGLKLGNGNFGGSGVEPQLKFKCPWLGDWTVSFLRATDHER